MSSWLRAASFHREGVSQPSASLGGMADGRFGAAAHTVSPGHSWVIRERAGVGGQGELRQCRPRADGALHGWWVHEPAFITGCPWLPPVPGASRLLPAAHSCLLPELLALLPTYILQAGSWGGLPRLSAPAWPHMLRRVVDHSFWLPYETVPAPQHTQRPSSAKLRGNCPPALSASQ